MGAELDTEPKAGACPGVEPNGAGSASELGAAEKDGPELEESPNGPGVTDEPNEGKDELPGVVEGVFAGFPDVPKWFKVGAPLDDWASPNCTATDCELFVAN